jgi:hypothetical protein
MAVERDVNYLYWGSMRTAKFGAGLPSLKSCRDEFRLVTQSYSRVAASLLHWKLPDLKGATWDCLDHKILADYLRNSQSDRSVGLVLFDIKDY